MRRAALITTAANAALLAGCASMAANPKPRPAEATLAARGVECHRERTTGTQIRRALWSCLLSGCLLGALVANAAPPEAVKQRDGQHDFDWDIGRWKVHMRRLLQPLSGSTTWAEYDGTDVVRKVWDGRANLGEVELAGPLGHLELLTLRLYNPESHQWSMNISNSTTGTLSPPAVGGFEGGHGEFYDQEAYNGKTILVRFEVSVITATSCRFEQAFSVDGGKTWEVNLIVTETLEQDELNQSGTGE
jgi:hypothetical protein